MLILFNTKLYGEELTTSPQFGFNYKKFNIERVKIVMLAKSIDEFIKSSQKKGSIK